MAAAVRICLCFKSLQSLTAAALLGRSKWRKSREEVSRECEVSMDVSFQGSSNETINGRVQLRRPELSLISLKVVLAASRASDQDVWGVYGCIFSWRFQWLHQWPFPTLAAGNTTLSAHTYVITWDCTHWPLYLGGRGVIRSCHLLTAATLSGRSDVIRIIFYLPMSPSLVCWISLTAVRKKVAMVPQGRGFRREGNKRRNCGSGFANL
jgi:hypothetical protein